MDTSDSSVRKDGIIMGLSKSIKRLTDEYYKSKTNEEKGDCLKKIAARLKERPYFEVAMQYVAAYNAMNMPSDFKIDLFKRVTGDDLDFLHSHSVDYYAELKGYKKCSTKYLCAIQGYIDLLESLYAERNITMSRPREAVGA